MTCASPARSDDFEVGVSGGCVHLELHGVLREDEDLDAVEMEPVRMDF
jgi:hypothetical protein